MKKLKNKQTKPDFNVWKLRPRAWDKIFRKGLILGFKSNIIKGAMEFKCVLLQNKTKQENKKTKPFKIQSYARSLTSLWKTCIDFKIHFCSQKKKIQADLEREIDTHRERSFFHICWFTPQMPATARARTRLKPGASLEDGKAPSLEPSLLPPRVHISWKLESEPRAGTWMQHGQLTWHRSHVPRCLPPIFFHCIFFLHVKNIPKSTF